MMDANEKILVRTNDENIQNILNRYSYYVEQAVNYGSHLILWDGDDSRSELGILKLMLRYFLDMLDALSILIKMGSAEACKSLLRTAFELNMSIHFICENHTKERADAFWIVDKYDQLKELEKLNSKSSVYKQVKAEFNKELIIKNFGSTVDGNLIRKQIQELQDELKGADYKTVVDEYDRVKLTTKKKIYWYQLFDGVGNIENMSKTLNKYTYYEVLYRKWSKTVHGNDALKDNIYTDEDGISYIVPIRHPVGLAMISKFACNFAINTFGYYIMKCHNDRLEEYRAWEKEFISGYEFDLGHEYIT